MATISQRITLDGGDDIKKQLEAIGVAGEKSFKQIQDAAQKSQIDPARFQQTKQAVDALATTGSQLANQFLKLAQAASAFGTQGAQATAQVTTGLNQTNAAAQGAGTSLLSAATAFKLAAAAIVVGISAVIKGLTTGTGETAKEISDQAGKLKISVAQWLELRKAIVAVDGSNDDFVKSAGTAVKIIGDAQKELLQLSKTYTVASDAGDGTTKTVTVTTGSMSSLTAATAKTITELRNFGVSAKALQSASPLAALRELATIIDRMPDGAAKATAGVKFFGDSWKDTIKVLSDVKKAVESDPLKASRELSADQVKAAKEAADAWDDLGTAIRATKDQIGALFSEGSKAKADWLTSLVDQSRELFKTWVGLSAQGRETFLKGLGDSGTQTAFKVLVAVSQQLAGIWTDVLVPAGEQLTAIVDEVAGNFAGISKSQVVAFFITIAVAVLALTIALKGISIVLTPVTALISLFATFGPIMIPLVALVVLFWDQIKEGAASAAALVPNSLRQIQQAFGLLFKGDFAGFWEAFSAAAVAAFQTITKAALDTPWIKTLVDGFKTIGEQIPGTLQLIGQGLISLGRAATGVANIFNKLFGTELTGTDVAAILIIGQLTGGLQALAAIAVIANAGLSILASTVALLGPAVGRAVAVAAGALGISVGLLTLIIGGVIGLLALLIVYWPQIKQAGIDAGNGIAAKWQELKALFNDWVTTPVANAWQWIVGVWDSIIAGISAWIAKGEQLITDFVTTPVANAWQWVKDTFNAVLQSLGLGGGSSGSSSDGGGGDGFASGGLLGGRGSGTSDSNLAWVSRGEYITPAAAVSQPGVLAFLEALRRSGGNLRHVLDGMGRFALGGMVRGPLGLPAFAGGGMNHITINFPGLPEITGLRASSGVVDELRKAAAMAQVRSGGRKPSRYS